MQIICKYLFPYIIYARHHIHHIHILSFDRKWNISLTKYTDWYLYCRWITVLRWLSFLCVIIVLCFYIFFKLISFCLHNIVNIFICLYVYCINNNSVKLERKYIYCQYDCFFIRTNSYCITHDRHILTVWKAVQFVIFDPPRTEFYTHSYVCIYIIQFKYVYDC